MILAALATVTVTPVRAQEPEAAPDTPQIPNGPPVTVRGVVLNAATGQPLPRALVRMIGNQGIGVLTNGEGRFEIRGVLSGVQDFLLTKPGFQEQIDPDDGEGFAPHAVRVADGMPELSFSLAPKNAISGHVTLSTGRPALGIGLVLFRQAIADGRVGWDEVDRHQTTPDGAFRYAGLSDGTYLLLSQAEFDNDRPTEPSCNADAPAEMTGYAPLFYTEATELAGAARISVAGGQNSEANLFLNLTKFHFVQVVVAHMPAGENWTLSYTLYDHSGRQVEYQIHKDKDNSVCVYLPDGSYTLAVQTSMEAKESTRVGIVPANDAGPRSFAGLVAFTVDGNAVRNVQVSLTPSVSTPVNLRYEPAPPEPVKERKKDAADREEEPDVSPLVLSATRVSAFNRNVAMSTQAVQTGENSYTLETLSAGDYWIHAFANRMGVCLGSVDAGGQSLARSPLTAIPSGAGTPINVVMRTDCASLIVQMPPALGAQSFGAGANLYVYAIPEFDSIEGISKGRLDQFNNRSTTFGDLPPGTYRVFASRTPRTVEYQNAAELDRMGAGQEVTLNPQSSVTLVLKDILK